MMAVDAATDSRPSRLAQQDTVRLWGIATLFYAIALGAFALIDGLVIRTDNLWRWAHITVWVLIALTALLMALTRWLWVIWLARITLVSVVALVVAMLISAFGGTDEPPDNVPVPVVLDDVFLDNRPQCEELGNPSIYFARDPNNVFEFAATPPLSDDPETMLNALFIQILCEDDVNAAMHMVGMKEPVSVDNQSMQVQGNAIADLFARNEQQWQSSLDILWERWTTSEIESVDNFAGMIEDGDANLLCQNPNPEGERPRIVQLRDVVLADLQNQAGNDLHAFLINRGDAPGFEDGRVAFLTDIGCFAFDEETFGEDLDQIEQAQHGLTDEQLGPEAEANQRGEADQRPEEVTEVAAEEQITEDEQAVGTPGDTQTPDEETEVPDKETETPNQGPGTTQGPGGGGTTPTTEGPGEGPGTTQGPGGGGTTPTTEGPGEGPDTTQGPGGGGTTPTTGPGGCGGSGEPECPGPGPTTPDCAPNCNGATTTTTPGGGKVTVGVGAQCDLGVFLDPSGRVTLVVEVTYDDGGGFVRTEVFDDNDGPRWVDVRDDIGFSWEVRQNGKVIKSGHVAGCKPPATTTTTTKPTVPTTPPTTAPSTTSTTVKPTTTTTQKVTTTSSTTSTTTTTMPTTTTTAPTTTTSSIKGTAPCSTFDPDC